MHELSFATARYLDISCGHRELSDFRDRHAFKAFNPLVYVPTVNCDDDQVLVDSTLIVDQLEFLGRKRWCRN